jgi:hypothetical protein
MPATIALTYNDYVTQVANMAVMQAQTVSGVVSGVDATFNTALLAALSYAELRIQRDLDLLPSLTSNTYNIAAGSNQVSIPVSDFVTIQTLSINGTPLLPVSKEFVQNVYGTSAVTGPPEYFAMIGGDSNGGDTSNNVLFGPYADANYSISAFGTVRLPSLVTYANTTDAGTKVTFISQWLPDLLLQASMIPIAQFQRNFGATSNDPQMGPTYEANYQTLLKGAGVEEARKRFAASAWSSMGQTPVATPSR